MSAPDEVDLGELSPLEARDLPSASDQLLKETLEDRKYEAERMRAWYEGELHKKLPKGFPWDVVLAFADWSARLALERDRLERMGW